jgi:predicted DNA-binding transcriptional regulator AlpA
MSPIIAGESTRSERAPDAQSDPSETEIDQSGPALIPLSESNYRIGISRNTAYAWIAAEQYPGAVRRNGRWYVRVAVLESWLAGR